MLMGSFRKYISTIFLFLLTFFSGFSQDWSQYGQDIDGEAVGDESGKSVAIGKETPQEWNRMLSLNLSSVTNMIRPSIPYLEKSNGAIVCISSITGIPINREIAMTGEVTLTGQVLPIGGLKEKLLAAHRAGIKKTLIPKDNEKDLAEIPKKVKDDIEIISVSNVDEVLKIALTKELKPVDWVEVETLSKSTKEDKTSASTH